MVAGRGRGPQEFLGARRWVFGPAENETGVRVRAGDIQQERLGTRGGQRRERRSRTLNCTSVGSSRREVLASGKVEHTLRGGG